MKKWESVFQNYPDVEEIYVVDNQPFIEKHHAENYAVATGKKIEIIKRPRKKKRSTISNK